VGKRIVVLGAGESSHGIIKTIKTMGHDPVVFGTHAEHSKPPFAEFYKVVEENDVRSVVEICKEIGVDGIVPIPVDRTLHWQSQVAHELGLIFIPVEKVENFRNKFIMKLCLQKNGIPCAKGILVNIDELSPGVLEDFSFPLIVKPIDQYASRGVTKANNYNELETYAKETLSLSRIPKVLVEEYIEGREFNAEGVCYNGVIEIYAIVEKISDPFPRTVEMGHIIPANITNKEEKTIVSMITKSVRSLEMKNGAFNAEIKLQNGKGCVIEVNGRLAGDFIISNLILPTTGQDMEKAVVNIALGIPPEKAKRDYIKHGMISFFNLPPYRKIRSIEDFSYLSENPQVLKTHLFYNVGDTTPEVQHMGHRSGFVIVIACSRDSMVKLAEETKEAIMDSIQYYEE